MGCTSSREADPWALAASGEAGKLQRWLELGGDCNAVDRLGGRGTLLHAAAQQDRVDCIRVLLAAGADVNAMTKLRGSPLHAAALHSSGQAVSLLLDSGANPTLPDTEGRTPIDLALQAGYVNTASLLQSSARKAARQRAAAGAARAPVPGTNRATLKEAGRPAGRTDAARAGPRSAAAAAAAAAPALQNAPAAGAAAGASQPLPAAGRAALPTAAAAAGPLAAAMPRISPVPATAGASHGWAPQSPGGSNGWVQQPAGSSRPPTAATQQIAPPLAAPTAARPPSSQPRPAPASGDRPLGPSQTSPNTAAGLASAPSPQPAALAPPLPAACRDPPSSGSSAARPLPQGPSHGHAYVSAAAGPPTPQPNSPQRTAQQQQQQQQQQQPSTNDYIMSLSLPSAPMATLSLLELAASEGQEAGGHQPWWLQQQPAVAGNVPPAAAATPVAVAVAGPGGQSGPSALEHAAAKVEPEDGTRSFGSAGAKSVSSTNSSSGANSLRSDPLLMWINSQVATRQHQHAQHGQQAGDPAAVGAAGWTAQATINGAGSGVGGSGSGNGHGSGSASSALQSPSSRASLADIKPWEIQYEDLVIQRPIGEGSFGKVYLAKWHETLVAVKVLLSLPDTQDPGKALALSNPALFDLHKECGLMAKLRHPNVVQFMGVSAFPPAMVTEYCAKGSLTDVLRAGRSSPQKAAQLTWGRRLNMLLDAAKGMLYLHKRGIIHRDLKSPNLLVDAMWRVKVADFNLSKIVEGGVSSTKTGTMAGANPKWLAPEVVAGQACTTASDCYSFGVVMWECLTWEVPWKSHSAWAIVGQLMSGARPEVPPKDQLPGSDSSRFSGLDDYIELMQQCWAQDPSERPRLEEVIHELRKLYEAAVTRQP